MLSSAIEHTQFLFLRSSFGNIAVGLREFSKCSAMSAHNLLNSVFRGRNWGKAWSHFPSGDDV